MKIPHTRLRQLITSIFKNAGCQLAEAERIAVHLVEANLVGHDSHGVIRVATYVQWLKAGKVLADRSMQVVFENDAIAVGIPIAGATPMLLDISACTLAEGKIRVALNKGVQVPENCIIDSEGRPTTDPKVFYANPPGAILPIAGHKGYGLALLCEVLAGALTGGGCSNPQNADKVLNGMLSIYLDSSFFQKDTDFAAEIQRFIAYVKSSARVTPTGDILMPGEIEERTKAQRSRDGLEIDATTWSQIMATAKTVGVPEPQV